MKKYMFLMLAFLVGVINASASTLATCKYNATIVGEKKEIVIDILDDKKLEVSPKSLRDGGDYFYGKSFYYSLNDFSDSMFADDKLVPECPTLSFCNEESTYSIRYNKSGVATCSNNSVAEVLEGEFINTSGSETLENQSKVVCEQFATNELDHEQQMFITFFYDAYGEKKFKILYNDRTGRGGSAYYNGTVTVGDKIYTVSDSLYDVYWKDENTCSGTQIYLKKSFDNSFVIVDEKPDPSESASPSDSTGHEEDKYGTSAPDKFNPNNACKGENCDISLNRFCEEATVSRTMKFLGIILYLAKIFVPTIIIVMGFYNLFQIITSGKDDDAKKYAKNIVKRMIIGVLIFILPTVANFLYNTAEEIISPDKDGTFSNCVNCVLNPFDKDECKIKTTE